MLGALPRGFWAGVPWGDLCAGGLVVIADSLEKCVGRLLIWREAMERRGLRVNAGGTRVVVCGTGLDLLRGSGECLCAVCRAGVGSGGTCCSGCELWVHGKCGGLQRLAPGPGCGCARCMGGARPVVGGQRSGVRVVPGGLEVVASFCCFGGMLSAGRGCGVAVAARVKTAWGWGGSGSCCWFSHPTASLAGPVAVCAALACGAQCSVPVGLGRLPGRDCGACGAVVGPWSDRSAVSGWRVWPG